MKDIICFTASLASGGAEHQMLILADFLKKKGYNVKLVVCFDYPDHYTLPDSLNVERLNVKGNRIQKEWTIIKYFIKCKADTIISFREQINFMVLIPMLFRKKINVIVGERNLTIGRPSFYGWLDLNLLYRRANYIVTNSHSQEEFIRNYTKRYNDKICTIINYTEFNKYQYHYHVESNSLVIGVFCRYSKQKNYERFAKAIKLVKDRCDKAFQVHWYGARFSQGREKEDYIMFSSIIDELNISDVLILHDAARNVHEILGNMDAICQPSIFEGFSNSLSEGICCGKVALAGDVSDNSAMVKHGINGFLFDPYSVEDMANKIQDYLELGCIRRKEMCMKSREVAVSLFNSDLFVNSYIKLIESK